MDSLTLILTLFFGAVTVFGGIGTYLFLRDRAKAKRESAELQERLDRIEKSVGQTAEQVAIYLDGLAETKGRKKIRLLNEALRATEEYRHEEAIVKFREALPFASNDSERCAILNQIGLSQHNIGKSHDAINTLLEMTKIAKQENLSEALAAGYNNIGNIFGTLGEFLKTLEYYLKAFTIIEKSANLEEQTKHLSIIGNVYRSLGATNKAVEFYRRALKIDEKIGNLEGQARDLGNIGIIYYFMRELTKSLEYHQKALKIDEKTDNYKGQIQDLINIGAVYLLMNNNKEALDCFLRAKEISVKIGAEFEIMKVNHNIALARQKLTEQGK